MATYLVIFQETEAKGGYTSRQFLSVGENSIPFEVDLLGANTSKALSDIWKRISLIITEFHSSRTVVAEHIVTKESGMLTLEQLLLNPQAGGRRFNKLMVMILDTNGQPVEFTQYEIADCLIRRTEPL